jgi:hypothetical protein
MTSGKSERLVRWRQKLDFKRQTLQITLHNPSGLKKRIAAMPTSAIQPTCKS